MKNLIFLGFIAAVSTLSLSSTQAHSQTSPPDAWVVAGVRLGEDFEKLFEQFDKSKAMIEARGFVIADGIETSRRVWFYKEGVQDPAPDVIERYKFQIRDGQVYVNGEADGKKRLTMLQFKQTAEGSGEQRLKMLTDRYGAFSREDGGTYTWGCASHEVPCLKGEPKDWALTVTLRHADAMGDWVSQYRTLVSAAKGESSESKF